MRSLARATRIAAVAATGLLPLASGPARAQTRSPTPSSVQVGPETGLLPSGRLLTPFGDRVGVGGNFSHGAALTPDQQFLWTVQAGEGVDDVRIVSLRGRRVVQTLRLPGASGGIAIAGDGRHAYVSGEPDAAERPGGDTPPQTPGRAGDVIHVFAIAPSTGTARETGVISVAPPGATTPPQDFPPTRTSPLGWPQGLALSPDGSTLLVALSLSDQAAVVDLRTRSVRFVAVGSYPYGAAVLSDNRTGLISNEGPGTVSVIDLVSATKTADIQVGAPLSHPEGITVDPRGSRAFVALANTDQIAVLDTGAGKLAASASVARTDGLGESPVDLSVIPGSRGLLVANAGADDISVLGLPTPGTIPGSATDYPLLGRIPTADYPVAAFATSHTALPCRARAGVHRRRVARRGSRHRVASRRVPRRRRHPRPPLGHLHRHRRRHRPRRASGAPPTCTKLIWVSAKSLGLGANTKPVDPRYLDNAERQLGTVGIADFPSAAGLEGLTSASDRQIHPMGAGSPPAGTPLRPDGPIRHVFYFVRENRNYDQVLGDLRPGDGDGALAIFGQAITPNMHALAQRFGTLDRVFADSQVSIDGHMWTSGAQASDFVERNNHPSNAGRNYPYNFVYSIAAPDRGFIFDQARRDNVSWMNFGEGIASLLPIPDKDRTPQGSQESAAKYSQSDLGVPSGCYPADAYIGKDPLTQQSTFDSSPPPGAPSGSESRFDCFRAKFILQQATNSVPALTYLTTVDDHTQGTTPGMRTPRAMMASSDWGLGEFVDAISHSSIWPQTAIFVVEDDTQEGLDHVDAHRMPAFVISPYSRPGTVISSRYDQLSVLRSIELITGLHPLGMNDALATPMYDAFQSTPDLRPYNQIVPSVDMAALNGASAADASLSRSLDFGHLDGVPQRTLDTILWHAMRGEHSSVPPVGPHASTRSGDR